MDDWAFQESSDSAMGTVNNVHLLWKFQTLDSLGLSEQHNDTTTNRPLQDNETSTFIPSEANRTVPDDLQQDIDRILNMPTEDIVPSPVMLNDSSSLHNNNASYPPEVLFSGSSSSYDINELPTSQSPMPTIPNISNTLTAVRRKRSRSPSLSIPLADDRPMVKLRTNESVVPEITTVDPSSFLNSNYNNSSVVPASASGIMSVDQGQQGQLLQQQQQTQHHASDTPKATTAIKAKSFPRRPRLRVHIQKPSSKSSLASSASPIATGASSPSIVKIIPEPSDPMQHRLDGMGIKRLTIAILRRLGVVLDINELPPVDNNDQKRRGIDSRQVLPLPAMQVITTMILGTSGDKDVSQTDGSQISNGDLVAVQRMVIEGLRVKNISINTVITKRLISSNAIPVDQTGSVTRTDPSNNDRFIDLSNVKYELPLNVTRLFLRLYRFILNMLLATPDCWPFIQPVPDSAVLYHQEIKTPMDLSTVEKKAWQGTYTTFSKFEKDILLIWRNAKSYHSNTGTIPKHADKLDELFRKIVLDLKTQIRPSKNQKSAPSNDFRFDPMERISEENEITSSLLSRLFSPNSTVYTISAMSPLEPKAKQRGLTHEKLLYLQLNGPFFQALERMKKNPTADHQIIPRFYIAKNRTFLEQVSAYGVLAIFYNTRVKRLRPKRYEIETDIVITYPASPLYDIDRLNKDTHELAPKAWIHLRPLRVVENATFEANETVERDYFRRMYTTARIHALSYRPPPTKGGSSADDIETKLLLRKIARNVLSLPTPTNQEEDDKAMVKIVSQVKDEKSLSLSSSTSTSSPSPSPNPILSSSPKSQQLVKSSPKVAVLSNIKKEGKVNGHVNSNSGSFDKKHSVVLKKEEQLTTPAASHLSPKLPSPSSSSSTMVRETDHEVWRKLFQACREKGVDVQNISEKYSFLNLSAPNSEGYFKQVYFLEGVVIQTFRQMTMYQRITEIACLMKLRNLSHMAQMREVIYNDNGDIVGLTMERYQETLKQYTHVHSHHRLSAHQKYCIIRQMINCIKIIHDAGLAHRDLSEVNFMVNRLDNKLEDGSENVYLYLIDFGKSVFCEPQDVRDWFVDVPREKWEYDGDVVPESKEELEQWCANLPWVKGKPDHGYRMYRSIQTLPKTRSDTQVLPWLIHPKAEDIYSIGVMIWKTFTDTEPWRGVLDTDLQGLRYVAEDDYRIERALQQDIKGEISQELLLKCLRTRPQDRVSATELLEWFESDQVKAALLEEWKTYSSESRATRKAKTTYGYDETEDETKRRRKRKTNPSNSSINTLKGKGRSSTNINNNNTAPLPTTTTTTTSSSSSSSSTITTIKSIKISLPPPTPSDFSSNIN